MSKCFICGGEFSWFELFPRADQEICTKCLESSGTEFPVTVAAKNASQVNLKSLKRERIRARAK